MTDLNRGLGTGLIAAGAGWADTAAEVATISDVVFTCLPSGRDRRGRYRPGRAPRRARVGATWIDNSTNDRDETLRLAAICTEHGVGMVECSVTGGVHKAAIDDIPCWSVVMRRCSNNIAPPRNNRQADPLHGFTWQRGDHQGAHELLAFVHVVAVGEALMLAKRVASISRRRSRRYATVRATVSFMRPRAR